MSRRDEPGPGQDSGRRAERTGRAYPEARAGSETLRGHVAVHLSKVDACRADGETVHAP